ncbi:MAG: iron donor protein CyaY [Rickettsiales bacterium]|nr:iron donor protein CyaY [Rickettsiales bacterium]
MNNFEINCNEFLEDLSESIENFDVDAKFDVDYSDGILNLLIEDSGQTYVINRHSASKKIWYSSPLSGADYFSYSEREENWLNDKGDVLTDKLFKELKTF